MLRSVAIGGDGPASHRGAEQPGQDFARRIPAVALRQRGISGRVSGRSGSTNFDRADAAQSPEVRGVRRYSDHRRQVFVVGISPAIHWRTPVKRRIFSKEKTMLELAQRHGSPVCHSPCRRKHHALSSGSLGHTKGSAHQEARPAYDHPSNQLTVGPLDRSKSKHICDPHRSRELSLLLLS
jgi:hypothetical protein